LKKLDGPDESEEPQIVCPNKFSQVPSEFFGETADSFCGDIKDNFDNENKDVPYNIHGAKDDGPSRRSWKLFRRAPPEKPDYYDDYTFLVSWIPKEGECLAKSDNMCTRAFKKLVQSQPCESMSSSPLQRPTNSWKVGRTTVQQRTE
jgi:hypothetical protein